MRTFRHWTLRYLYDRSIEKMYRRLNPDLPWLSPVANEILESWLKPTDQGLEFGSGRSTLWFSEGVKSLTSVEHNPEWYRLVSERLNKLNRSNTTYFLHPKRDGENEAESPYVSVAHQFPANSLDFVMVDGIYRDACTLASLSTIRPGGILILDNAHLYFPCQSRSPNARRPGSGAASAGWETALQRLANWRCIWTSNGVSDTALYFKPC